MLGTEFVFSSLVSQLFDTKNSGFSLRLCNLLTLFFDSRTVMPRRARSSFNCCLGLIYTVSPHHARESLLDSPEPIGTQTDRRYG